MIGGRVSKFLKESSLVDQPFVKDPDTTVGKLVAAGGAEVVSLSVLKWARESKLKKSISLLK